MARPTGTPLNHWALADFREARGLSRSTVAVRSDCGAGHYSDIENGKARPSVELLHRIAAVLEVNPLSLRTDLPSVADEPQAVA